jgi:hypothetical protein
MKINYALRAAQNIQNLSIHEEAALISSSDFRERVARHFKILYGDKSELEIETSGSKLIVRWFIHRDNFRSFTPSDLQKKDIKSEIIISSPSVSILLALQERKICLEDLKLEIFGRNRSRVTCEGWL